jgi:hypothetical protein
MDRLICNMLFKSLVFRDRNYTPVATVIYLMYRVQGPAFQRAYKDIESGSYAGSSKRIQNSLKRATLSITERLGVEGDTGTTLHDAGWASD